MNSAIICEGATDFVLLEYYLRTAYGWEDYRKPKYKYENERARGLKHNNDLMSIVSAGGVSNLIKYFEQIIQRNLYSIFDEDFFVSSQI